ncbi:hypothetical protein HKX48_004125 [Thoreauomyces humboldtii]|nr:hypothetical protein HKX48_004125 [Thoreauomyces humboldtii]
MVAAAAPTPKVAHNSKLNIQRIRVLAVAAEPTATSYFPNMATVNLVPTASDDDTDTDTVEDATTSATVTASATEVEPTVTATSITANTTPTTTSQTSRSPSAPTVSPSAKVFALGSAATSGMGDITLSATSDGSNMGSPVALIIGITCSVSAILICAVLYWWYIRRTGLTFGGTARKVAPSPSPSSSARSIVKKIGARTGKGGDPGMTEEDVARLERALFGSRPRRDERRQKAAPSTRSKSSTDGSGSSSVRHITVSESTLLPVPPRRTGGRPLSAQDLTVSDFLLPPASRMSNSTVLSTVFTTQRDTEIWDTDLGQSVMEQSETDQDGNESRYSSSSDAPSSAHSDSPLVPHPPASTRFPLPRPGSVAPLLRQVLGYGETNVTNNARWTTESSRTTMTSVVVSSPTADLGRMSAMTDVSLSRYLEE